MQKLRLKFQYIQTMVGCPDIALIVLTDEQETRQLNIVCDGYTRLQFLVRLNQLDPKNIRFHTTEEEDSEDSSGIFGEGSGDSSSPFGQQDDQEQDFFGNHAQGSNGIDPSHDLAGQQASKSNSQMLPEVLVSMIQYMTNIHLESYIYNVYDGEYRALIVDQRTGTTFRVRAADAVLLHVVNRHIPLTVDSALWMHQSMPFRKDGQNVALPINTLSIPMLKDALNRAIEEERYEAAKFIKEELERRK